MKGIIYKATNKINGKSYIGQTIKPFDKRKYQHLFNSKHKPTMYFPWALRKYGYNNFEWIILETINIEDKQKFINILNNREQHFVKYFNTFKNGYNMTLGGKGTNGYICSLSTRKKIGKANKGRIVSEETREKIRQSTLGEKHWAYGLKISSTQKIKCSINARWKGITGENNPFSKEYIIITDTKIFSILGLSQFSRENNLSHSHMSSVATGNRKHHKGYFCYHIPCILYNEQE